LITDTINKRGVARQRALKLAQTRLKYAAIVGGRDLVDIRWLRPHQHIITSVRAPGERQDCIVVHIALIWREAEATTLWQRWLLEVADHAAGRFLQLAPQADLRQAMFEAAQCFVASSFDHVICNQRGLYLRAGPGAFAADMVAGKIEGSGKERLPLRALPDVVGRWNAGSANIARRTRGQPLDCHHFLRQARAPLGSAGSGQI
jgi:hypothetical protein